MIHISPKQQIMVRKKRAWRKSYRLQKEEEARQLQQGFHDTSAMALEVTNESVLQDDEESIDSDDDGGVLLMSYPDHNEMHNGLDSPVRLEMMKKYFQQPIENFNQTAQLWQHPPGEILRPKATKGKRELLIPRLYERYYRLTKNAWHRGFQHWIPDHLRDKTPYSLALLYHIRRLASNTKENYEIAQRLISRTYEERIASLGNPQLREHHFIESYPTIHPDCERTVYENIHGVSKLMWEKSALKRMVATWSFNQPRAPFAAKIC